MDIDFVKIHSCGKDYVLFNGIRNVLPDEEYLGRIARAITHRHFGAGGYGFILITQGKNATISARVFNNRGNELEPEPDALRCLGRYTYDAGLLSIRENRVETGYGIFTLAMIDNRNITVNIGSPYNTQTADEIIEKPDLNLDRSIAINGRNYTYTPVGLAGPNSVLFEDNGRLSIVHFAKRLKEQPGFTSPPEVHSVRVYSREELRVRSWHPQYGRVLSSGSGEAAAVVAAVLHGFTDRDVMTHNRGGSLFIRWDSNSNNVFITGPVDYSYTGSFSWESPEEAKI